jgi:hypothetical protein
MYTFVVNGPAFLAILRGKRDELRTAYIDDDAARPREALPRVDFVSIRLGYACKSAGCSLLFQCCGHGVLKADRISAGFFFKRDDHITYLGACFEWANIYSFLDTKVGKALGATITDIREFLYGLE